MSWLSGYAYRQKIKIDGTNDGAQSNYQMKLAIIRGAGSSSSGTCYLKTHALNWPNDVRFTKADGTTLLDFWREESDATDGTWWIEFDSIASGGGSPSYTYFYIYYGKSGDSDASSGVNTFIQYHGSATADFLDSAVTAVDSSMYYRGRLKCAGATGYNILWGIADTSDFSNDGIYMQACDSKAYHYARNSGAYSSESEDNPWADDNWHIAEMKLLTGVSLHSYVDGDEIGSGISTNLPGETMGLWMREYAQDGEQEWSFIAKYTANEPTWGTWGSEEALAKTKTYTADALLKKLGITKTYTADTLLKKLGILETVDADALIKKLGITTTVLAKAIFGAALIQEVTADALFKALGLTQTLDVDTLLQQQDITQDITADAIINLIATRSIDVDALLRGALTKTFTADVRLGEMGVTVFTASVYFKRLAYHVILDAQYITETPEVNRAYVIGRDAEGNPVHGADLEQSEIDLVGERLDFTLALSIPTSSKAADVADAMLKKQRLSKHRGFITIPPNAGAELWDVIQVTDKLCAQSSSKYRIVAITFDYEPRQRRYQHKLILGAP